MAPETITVVLADDHEIVRDGIRMVLEAEADIEVVAEAGGAIAARYVLGQGRRVGSRPEHAGNAEPRAAAQDPASAPPTPRWSC